MNRKILTQTALAMSFGFAFPAANSVLAAEFISLGDLPGGAVQSQAFGVSLDGNFVVGIGTTAAGTEAFRWSSVGGMESLGDLAGGATASKGLAVSMDGKIVVGQATSAAGKRAFRWVEGQGMAELGSLPSGAPATIARGVSADGTVVVGGSCTYNSGACTTEGGLVDGEPFRWTDAGGIQDLKPYPPDLNSGAQNESGAGMATGVSADGMVVIGLISPNGHYLFQWNPVDGMSLPLAANSSSCSQWGCSYGYTTFVGGIAASGVGYGSRPGSGKLSTPVGTNSLPNLRSPKAVSSDTSVVVGNNGSDYVMNNYALSSGPAKIWTKASGTQDLKTFLTGKGLDLTNWTLIDATGISADGRTIVGYGTDPSGATVAWRARF